MWDGASFLIPNMQVRNRILDKHNDKNMTMMKYKNYDLRNTEYKY